MCEENDCQQNIQENDIEPHLDIKTYKPGEQKKILICAIIMVSSLSPTDLIKLGRIFYELIKKHER